MQRHDAKILLGFPPQSCPSPSQVKAAYRRKVWETHPDRFSDHEKSRAECKFKLVSEAYSCLQSDARTEGLRTDSCSRVVKTGVPRVYGGRRNHALIGLPFLFIILGTFTLGGSNIARAYKKQKEAYPSHNPFLPWDVFSLRVPTLLNGFKQIDNTRSIFDQGNILARCHTNGGIQSNKVHYQVVEDHGPFYFLESQLAYLAPSFY